MRFIKYYLDNPDTFRFKPKDDLVKILLENDFVDYDRLLAMPIWNLTKDKIEELSKQLDDEKKELSTLESTTAKEMYTNELKAIK